MCWSVAILAQVQFGSLLVAVRYLTHSAAALASAGLARCIIVVDSDTVSALPAYCICVRGVCLADARLLYFGFSAGDLRKRNFIHLWPLQRHQSSLSPYSRCR